LKVLWAKGLTGDSPRESRVGDNGWTDITIEFEVVESDPTLSFELRGGSGTAWLDRNSVSLTRLR
jgi:hypothetical protein